MCVQPVAAESFSAKSIRSSRRYCEDTLFASGHNRGGPESGAPVLDIGGGQPEIRDARRVRSESETEITRRLAVLPQAEQHMLSEGRIHEIAVETRVPGGDCCFGSRPRPQTLGNPCGSQGR